VKPIDELSLGWRTDLIFARFDAQVVERPDCLVVRTPHNPTFYWGNFLLFDHPPVDGDAATWLARFDEEIARGQATSRHVAFGVDAEQLWTVPSDMAAAGLTLDAATVLTMQASQLRVPRRALASQFSIRALALPAEEALAVEQQVASDEGSFEPAGYRVFRQRQMQRYGAMVAAGLGDWFGVFAVTPQGVSAPTAGGTQLVADCGLFTDGRGLGRFQYVSTHPAWRRRGLCTALIHAVCRHGFRTLGLHTLVIVADPADVAIGLYESLGFERGVTTWHLERRPADDAGT
jgi:RimJ/RimL family protein N-acetyltransferase